MSRRVPTSNERPAIFLAVGDRGFEIGNAVSDRAESGLDLFERKRQLMEDTILDAPPYLDSERFPDLEQPQRNTAVMIPAETREETSAKRWIGDSSDDFESGVATI